MAAAPPAETSASATSFKMFVACGDIAKRKADNGDTYYEVPAFSSVTSDHLNELDFDEDIHEIKHYVVSGEDGKYFVYESSPAATAADLAETAATTAAAAAAAAVGQTASAAAGQIAATVAAAAADPRPREAIVAGNSNELCYEDYLSELRQRVKTAFPVVTTFTNEKIEVQDETNESAKVVRLNEEIGNLKKLAFPTRITVREFVEEQPFLKHYFAGQEAVKGTKYSMFSTETKNLGKSDEKKFVTGLKPNIVEKYQTVNSIKASLDFGILVGRALEVLDEGTPTAVSSTAIPDCLTRQVGTMRVLMKDYANAGKGGDPVVVLTAWLSQIDRIIEFEIGKNPTENNWNGELGFLSTKLDSKIKAVADASDPLRSTLEANKTKVDKYIAALKLVRAATAAIKSENEVAVKAAHDKVNANDHEVAKDMAVWMTKNITVNAMLNPPAAAASSASQQGQGGSSVQASAASLGSAAPSSKVPGSGGSTTPSSGQASPGSTSTVLAAAVLPLNIENRLAVIEEEISELNEKIRVESHFLTGLAEARVKAMGEFGGPPPANVTAAANDYVDAVVAPLGTTTSV